MMGEKIEIKKPENEEISQKTDYSKNIPEKKDVILEVSKDVALGSSIESFVSEFANQLGIDLTDVNQVENLETALLSMNKEYGGIKDLLDEAIGNPKENWNDFLQEIKERMAKEEFEDETEENRDETEENRDETEENRDETEEKEITVGKKEEGEDRYREFLDERKDNPIKQTINEVLEAHKNGELFLPSESLMNLKHFRELLEMDLGPDQGKIEGIINDIDITSTGSFELTLFTIGERSDISDKTKLTIFEKFPDVPRPEIITGSDLKQFARNEEKNFRNLKNLEKALSDNIDDLEKELETLDPEDPKYLEKRTKLETKIKELKGAKKENKAKLTKHKENKEGNVEFPFRDWKASVEGIEGNKKMVVHFSENYKLRLPLKFLYSGNKIRKEVHKGMIYDKMYQIHPDLARVLMGEPNQNGIIQNPKIGNVETMLDRLGIPITGQIIEPSMIGRLDKVFKTFVERVSDSTNVKQDLERVGILKNGSVDKVRFGEALKYINDNNDYEDKLRFSEMEKDLVMK